MINKTPIGVMGCLLRLPNEFPFPMAENSGNMVHANAPIRMFENTFYIKDQKYNSLGFKNFSEFVNTKCSHLIITMANTLQLGDTDGTKYKRLLDFLISIKKPVVVFGLGIQAKTVDMEEVSLPAEAIDLIRYLSSKATYLGVRGNSTKMVLERLCGVTNAYVTGCPSIFSNRDAFSKLRSNLNFENGFPAFSGTRYFEQEENTLFANAIKHDHWLIEPVNRFNHSYQLKAIVNTDTYDDLPYFLKRHVPSKKYAPDNAIRQYFRSRYRLFRNVDDWYQFNSESVSYSYGTRFHVNMATLVSGKPALWLTHDARTRELVEFMNLPHIDVESPALLDTGSIKNLISYENFLDNLGSLHRNFNHYLEANGLPTIDLDH